MCKERLGAPAYSMISEIHTRGVDFIASFAGIAFDAARLGDSVALEIIEKSTDRICKLVNCARKNMGGTAQLVLSGGLLASKDVILPLIKKKICDVEIIVPDMPQILGAMRMCTSLLGADISIDLLKKRYGEIFK